jgi:hypothetical protein
MDSPIWVPVAKATTVASQSQRRLHGIITGTDMEVTWRVA